jgi:selenide, water dikinase
MGARPLFALSLIGFPRTLLSEGLLERIVEGAGAVVQEAGIAVLGGHSIDDPEPKFGMVVIGEVHPDRMLTNAGARAGDRLVLTKPIGTGVITTALRAGAAPEDAVAAAVRGMTSLNRAASEAALAAGARAATDITGFGLLGHLSRMAAASGLGAEISAAAVPLLPHAKELLGAGHVPGGTRRNLDDLHALLDVDDGVPDAELVLLADAQTSGGMLIAIDPTRLAELQTRLAAAATVVAADLGVLTSGQPGRVRVTR